jgi:hypothetical protein
MQKNICTWICVDTEGEESTYSQMKSIGKSTSSKFIGIYLKNCIVFFITSRKFNPTANLLLFTNANLPEKLEGLDFRHMIDQLGVKVIHVNFDYKTPVGYYGAWRNQFFEFSIFQKMLELSQDEHDLFLLTDSDCVVTGDLAPVWEKARSGCLTYDMGYPEQNSINGLTRLEMKTIYEQLLNKRLDHPPKYYGGEFFLANTASIKLIVDDFVDLWPVLLLRHQRGELKFNEEAHTLSYLFYKNGLNNQPANEFIKRLWTQPFIFRNVEAKDGGLLIWHLPHEKKYGILHLFKRLAFNIPAALAMESGRFLRLLSQTLTIPRIPIGVYVGRILPVQAARVAHKFLQKIKKSA